MSFFFVLNSLVVSCCDGAGACPPRAPSPSSLLLQIHHGDHFEWYSRLPAPLLNSDIIWFAVMSSLRSHVACRAALGSTCDPLMSLISLGLADWDGRNLLSEASINGVYLAAALAECLLTLHEGVVLEVSTLARQVHQLASSLDLLTTFHSERLGCLEGWCFELDQELGELQDAQVSSGYISVEDAVGEGEAIVEEGNTGEENFGMDEERLWSPSSSDCAVLTLVPDTSAFPTQ
ncbi:hypothetical protein BDM02DRAFT_3194170 [Thelephora ganbajun]|uniref:Uncharacterized protein n=1 Tax=Thelephora ganbajun TaxID=370292 RepID=A0ACB6YWZ2_THEGA|nr:hypothetical protein BDM02DRAFT_3194170 [Thelephora ganbajun]